MKYFKIICLEAEVVIIAKDQEEAAWTALQLSTEHDMTLIDVKPIKRDKRAYFPNKWQQIKDIDVDLFEDIDFTDFYEWRVCNHELMDGYHSVIRIHEKGKIKECVYKSRSAAVNRVKKLMKQNIKFDIATESGVTSYPLNV